MIPNRSFSVPLPLSPTPALMNSLAAAAWMTCPCTPAQTTTSSRAMARYNLPPFLTRSGLERFQVRSLLILISFVLCGRRATKTSLAFHPGFPRNQKATPIVLYEALGGKEVRNRISPQGGPPCLFCYWNHHTIQAFSLSLCSCHIYPFEGNTHLKDYEEDGPLIRRSGFGLVFSSMPRYGAERNLHQMFRRAASA